jgi:phospholipid/cholesterol/gamma-HCH transport system substrate-binding protein
MRGGRAGSLAASPTLVGAVTVLVVVVAVFLAYQANQGLPFVPTYKISAQVPNANTLVPGNEVRIGGIRVGSVKAVEPVQNDDGTVNAKLDLELNQDLDPLPVDSTVIVRSRSALGLKYLELDRGTSEDGYEPGATMPLSAATPEPVEIDQVFNTFDDPTRAAIQINLTEFGDALAGRGQALNAAIGDLRPLVDRLQPVMKNIASPRTDLSGFVNGLSAAAAEVAPVAAVQGQLFADLNTTFGAFANVARPYIQDTISKSPETEQTAIDTLPRIRPLLVNTTGLLHDLRPGFAALRPQARNAMLSVTIGVKALRQSPAFNAQLPPTVQSLLNFNNDANVREGLSDLDDFFTQAQPLLAYVGPAQSVCNYATLLFRNTANLVAYGDGIGTWQRFIPLTPATGPNSEGSPSSAPANGGGSSPNFLHSNPYPNTASAGQSPRECESGNENYIAGQKVIGNAPGDQGILTEGQTCTQLGNCKKKNKKKKKK